jgi:hypothetical protein
MKVELKFDIDADRWDVTIDGHVVGKGLQPAILVDEETEESSAGFVDPETGQLINDFDWGEFENPGPVYLLNVIAEMAATLYELVPSITESGAVKLTIEGEPIQQAEDGDVVIVAPEPGIIVPG